MLNHGVSTGALFLIVAMLSDRRHTRLIAEFGGLKRVMPRLTAAFLVVDVVVDRPAGSQWVCRRVPHSAGRFSMESQPCRGAAVGVILSAVYMLWMFQRVNYGEVTNEKTNLYATSACESGGHSVPHSRWRLLMGVPRRSSCSHRAIGQSIGGTRQPLADVDGSKHGVGTRVRDSGRRVNPGS